MSRSIRHQEITLHFIAGERTLKEIRTVTGISGDGTSNDLVSVRLALELGCRIKPSKCEQYGISIDGKPLEVVGILRLKIHRLEHFRIEPHLTNISVLVIYNLHKDILLSWPTQRQLRIPNSQHLNCQKSIKKKRHLSHQKLIKKEKQVE